MFKIITNALNKFSGISLLNVYDIFTLLAENYQQHFKNESLSIELIQCLVNKWYQTLSLYQNSPDNRNNTDIGYVFDAIISLVKAAGNFINVFIGEFLNGTLEILNKNYELFLASNKDKNMLDKDLITKCFDLISNIYIAFPSYMVNYHKKTTIVEYVFKYLEINENYLNHYSIALIGDIGRVDNKIFEENIKFILNTLIKNLDIPELMGNCSNKKLQGEPLEVEKLSVSNNSCWTIGILAVSYPTILKEFIHPIMQKLTKIISLPRVNNSFFYIS